jgi:uncharacterized protein (TIGR03790 family)
MHISSYFWAFGSLLRRSRAGLFRLLMGAVLVLGLIASVRAQESGLAASAPEPAASEPLVPPVPRSASTPVPTGDPVRKWANAPRVFGHLSVKDVGLVINVDDPYSVKVGRYYAQARQIPEDQILRVSLPVRGALTVAEFDVLARRIDEFFGARVQGLALAWRLPYAVDCNSLSGALAMGYDAKLCSNSCAVTRQSSYFGSASTKPLADHRMRLSMQLAAKDVEGAKALIDRGIKSDGTLGLRGSLPAQIHFVTTSDHIRSQRQLLFPPAGKVSQFGLEISLDQTDALRNADRVLIYMTGRAQVEGLGTVGFLPGALADHLTSFGGRLDDPMGQMSVLSWIDAGATATYGTASEPCAHLQKFPNPQALVLFYVQGATAMETYWKSVAWPQQGVFVGEPLAAPFAR